MKLKDFWKSGDGDSFWRMRVVFGLALVGFMLFQIVAGVAHAQTSTRVTPCDAATPNNALCVSGTAPTTNTDGTPVVPPLTYRVEQKSGTGAYATVATALATPQYYAKGLTPGTHTFRMFVNCTTCTSESAASNEASGTASANPRIPNPPIITIAVVISSDRAPVYRILSGNKRGEFFGLIPAGRECTGPILFRYRGASFRQVAVQPSELWGTADPSHLAAPCLSSQG